MNQSKKLLIAKISLALLGVLTVVLMIEYLPVIRELTVSINKFREFILSIGNLGPVVFFLFQILQTVIAPIPGEAVQITGGYIYGVLLGTIYTAAGMLVGAFMAFYFARLLGGSYVEKLLNRKKLQWMKDIVISKKFTVFLFAFFFIPGLPKDILIYLAGLTSIKPAKFFGILLVGRLPWLIASVSIGANIYHENYTSTIIISIIVLGGFLLGLLCKEKLINRFTGIDKSTE